MKKILSIVLFFILDIAAAEAQYVRKKVVPGFFIPSREIVKREQLPPFPAWEEAKAAVIAETKAAEQAATQQAADMTESDDISDEYAIEPEAEIEENEADEEEAAASNPKAFGNSPRYLRNMAQYEEDLLQISQTGSMPENSELKQDLQKMTSDELLELPSQP